MQILAVQTRDPVRLCWSQCIAVHPMHLQHLCSTFIGILAEVAGIEGECLVFEPFRWVRTIGDLGHIPWDFLVARLPELAPYPCPQLEEAISHVRLFAALALVHHQVWSAKSGSTLKLLGRCRLPQDLPPELSFLHREFEQRLAEADRALQAGRAKLTHFQRQALPGGYPLPALLWTILRHTRVCYQEYRGAIKAAYDLVGSATWYVSRVERKAAASVQADRSHLQPTRQARERSLGSGQLQSTKRGDTIDMAASPTRPLAAFCTTCPPARAVTDVLAALGFTLIFSMEEQREPAYMQIPPVPAQYHYREDTHGTEVIYLAGQDASEEGDTLPPHASRFWIHPGASPQATQLVAQIAAQSWQLSWAEPAPEQQREAVA
jgi:hypothetical protein